MRILIVILTLTLAACTPGQRAYAEPRASYSNETTQPWVRQTLRTQRREDRKAERRAYYGYQSDETFRPRYTSRYMQSRPHRSRNLHYYAAPAVEHSSRRLDAHIGYGATCKPPIKNISRSYHGESKALNDAELGWMKAAASEYGEIYADIANINRSEADIRCWRSSFDEGWIARNREAAAQVTGTGDGYKSTCSIVARPCIAPPMTGDVSKRIGKEN